VEHLPRNTVVLQLEPPELGHIRVQVRLTDERLSAAFWADSPEVRTLLHTHLPTLQQALTQHGFQTQQISIALAADGLSDYAGQFSQQHSAFQSFSHGSEPGIRGGLRAPLIAQGTTTDKYAHDGLVDVVI
jgi:flagellar hook-length control protein FliK